MDIDHIALLAVASFFTSILSATISMAGGTVLLSLMCLMLPLKIVLPLHATNQFMSNLSRCILLRNYIINKYFWSFIAGAVIGNIASTLLIKYILNIEQGAILIAFMIFYTLFKPKKMPSLIIERKGFFLVGIIIGFLGMFLGATGLILGIFFARDDLSKNQIVATQGAMQTFNHFSKMIGFLYLGFNFLPWVPVLLCMMIAGILGTNLGIKLLQKMSEKIFHQLYKIILLLSALKIVFEFILKF